MSGAARPKLARASARLPGDDVRQQQLQQIARMQASTCTLAGLSLWGLAWVLSQLSPDPPAWCCSRMHNAFELIGVLCAKHAQVLPAGIAEEIEPVSPSSREVAWCRSCAWRLRRSR